MTSFSSWSYSCLHCFLSAESDGVLCPSGAGVFFFAATHLVKSGGSGTAVDPPWA